VPGNLRLLATTATANDRVLADLEYTLGPNLTVFRGDLNRPSLLLQTMKMSSQPDRLAWLATYLPQIPGSGIIYTLTIRDAAQVAEWLQSRGINAEAYTSETGERRVQLENALLANQVKVIVATTALGMGFDKPDLGFVIHYQMPGSVVAYYQQVGRAVRALAAAYGVLLSGKEETEILDFFIEKAFPTREEVQRVLDALHSASGGLSIPELEKLVNVSRGRIDKALQLLSLESPAPIAKEGSKWQLTAANLSVTFWERAERLTELRRVEQQQMQEYAGLTTGHMEFLIAALDGNPGALEQPNLIPLPVTVDPALIHEGVAFLRRTTLPLDPRKQWPGGGLPHMRVMGKIATEYQAQLGKVLCVWGDAGWGDLVRRGKYHDGRFADDLVVACTELVRAWSPQPSPTWITCIPSRRHPDLVPDFAQRLAAALNLPFYSVLEKTDERSEQKTMANSSQQARNIDGSLTISAALPHGPVLLIDDMVDSRWTLTVAAYLLATHGSGLVYPLALALTTRAE